MRTKDVLMYIQFWNLVIHFGKYKLYYQMEWGPQRQLEYFRRLDLSYLAPPTGIRDYFDH